MRTLLHKTNVRIIICLVSVFILTAPLFYLITRYFYAEDLIDMIETMKRGEGIPPAFDLEQDVMAGVMLQYLLTFSVIAIALFIAMRFMLGNLWTPFEATLKSMEHFRVSDVNLPALHDGGTMEFHKLNTTLTNLMKRNIESYRQQKEFTENASHELLTPLAVMQSRLDILLQTDFDRATLESINELYHINRRMQRLDRDLLFLARIDNRQFVADGKVDVSAIIRTTIDSLAPMGYEIATSLPEHGLEVMANKTLLESLVGNLIVNAVRHSGCAYISLLATGRFMVSNPSNNGKTLDRDRLFRRFASSPGSKGHGLGLSIAKAVCDCHGWTLTYDFIDGLHRFTVRMKPDMSH